MNMRNELIMRGLSNRESEVVELISKGLSKKEAANQLFVTEKTIRFHLDNVKLRTGITHTELIKQYKEALEKMEYNRDQADEAFQAWRESGE